MGKLYQNDFSQTTISRFEALNLRYELVTNGGDCGNENEIFLQIFISIIVALLGNSFKNKILS